MSSCPMDPTGTEATKPSRKRRADRHKASLAVQPPAREFIPGAPSRWSMTNDQMVKNTIAWEFGEKEMDLS